MRTPTGFTVRALLALALVGCSQTKYPLAPPPQFSLLPPNPAGGIRPVSYEEAIGAHGGDMAIGSKVVLEDLRPDWERHFRSPAVRPSQHEYAIGFVPLESLNPPGALENAVHSSLARTGLPAKRALVELRSFRVVVNDTEALGHDHDVLERVNRNNGMKLGPFSLGIGASVSSDPVEPQAMFDNELARQRNGMFRPVLLRDGKRYLFGPPRELPTQAYSAGVTCEIDATVNMTGPHGSSKKFLVQVRQHTGPADRTATSSPAELAQTVQRAMHDFERRLTQRITMEMRRRS